jgi:hypothetical protein
VSRVSGALAGPVRAGHQYSGLSRAGTHWEGPPGRPRHSAGVRRRRRPRECRPPTR